MKFLGALIGGLLSGGGHEVLFKLSILFGLALLVIGLMTGFDLGTLSERVLRSEPKAVATEPSEVTLLKPGVGAVVTVAESEQLSVYASVGQYVDTRYARVNKPYEPPNGSYTSGVPSPPRVQIIPDGETKTLPPGPIDYLNSGTLVLILDGPRWQRFDEGEQSYQFFKVTDGQITGWVVSNWLMIASEKDISTPEPEELSDVDLLVLPPVDNIPDLRSDSHAQVNLATTKHSCLMVHENITSEPLRSTGPCFLSDYPPNPIIGFLEDGMRVYVVSNVVRPTLEEQEFKMIHIRTLDLKIDGWVVADYLLPLIEPTE